MYGKCHTVKTKQKIQEATRGKNAGANNPAYGKRKGELETIIVQHTKAYECFAVYRSIMDAERKTHINHAHIISVCRNIRKTAGGFIWKYLYDQTLKDGTTIPGAITLGLITEEEALKILEKQQEGS